MNAPFFAKKETFDPYADLEKPSEAEPNLREGGDSQPSVSASSPSVETSSSNRKKRSLEIDVNDIEPVLIKLRDHLVGTNPMKIEKAAGLMLQYLDGKLDDANADLFLKYISSLNGKEDELYATPYAKIVRRVREK